MKVDLNYNTINIFPVPVHNFEVNGFSEIQDELIDYAYKLKVEDPVGSLISNEGGWQSHSFEIHKEDDILQFYAHSDSKMVKGLLYILTEAFSGYTPNEMLNFNISDYSSHCT